MPSRQTISEMQGRQTYALYEVIMRRSDFHLRVRCGLVLFLAIALLTAAAPFAFAQEASAGIIGKVTDPSGAAVANANVTARDTERGTAWTTKTNDEGGYTFTRLPVGRYELKVESSGFQTSLHTASRRK